MKNCVNCGAPIAGAKCEFCGTRYDITAIKSKIAEVQLHTDGRKGLWNFEEYDASREYRFGDIVRFNGGLCVVSGGSGAGSFGINEAHISNARITEIQWR